MKTSTPPLQRKASMGLRYLLQENTVISPRAGTYEYPDLVVGVSPGSHPTMLEKSVYERFACSTRTSRTRFWSRWVAYLPRRRCRAGFPSHHAREKRVWAVCRLDTHTKGRRNGIYAIAGEETGLLGSKDPLVCGLESLAACLRGIRRVKELKVVWVGFGRPGKGRTEKWRRLTQFANTGDRSNFGWMNSVVETVQAMEGFHVQLFEGGRMGCWSVKGWVTSLRLQCGEYHPLESSIAPLSWGTCDILEPAADVAEPVGQSRLFIHRQLQSAPLEWPRNSTVGQVQSLVRGYDCWARYVLQAHRGRGTCWIGAEKFTITLSDLQAVSELPVFGHHIEECIPPEEQLFQRVLLAYGDRRVSVPELPCMSTVGVSLYDPFGLGLQFGTPLSEETAEPISTSDRAFPRLSGVREDLLLVGFLATWLCTFVLLVRTGSLRCNVLLAASQLGQGQRLLLAPVVQAEFIEFYAPFFRRVPLRHVTQFCRCSTCIVDPSFLLCPTVGYRQIRFNAPVSTVSLPQHQKGTVIVDRIDHRDRRTLLLLGQSLAIIVYFRSIRPGWLCYRAGATMTLEGYQPNRVARQFEYSQATPFDGRPVVSGLTWVQLSFGPALEHGTRRYESRVRGLRSSRGSRPRRGFLDATFDRDTEPHTTAGAIVPSPARASNVATKPHHAETARPSRRRVGSQRTSSSRMSVDVHTLLGDSGENSQRPRRSDFTGYSTLDPMDDFSFLVYPYGSFCLGEFLEADAGFLSKFLETPSYTPATLDLVPAEFSLFPECPQTDAADPSSVPANYSADSASPSTMPEGSDYTSKTLSHVPLSLTSMTTEMCSHLVQLLRKLISSIDLRSPESWHDFSSTANQLLSLLVQYGEVDRLTTRLKDLWRDFRQAMSRRLHVQERHSRRNRLIKKEEQHHRSLQQEVLEADSSLARAVEKFQIAQSEFQILARITNRLEKLRARLF
ncbi:hypothetical protein MA16_Dca008453 [Dendrobium catenatum]|uniref:Uncharacterized protein n=1 Tax=Dendrobium catenatum TaxID=906689 RepID=A0A2I0XHG1_9ASPA|nr:hypothetical protein MA16_Dca008453 [Dendrobium catenatum]